MARTGGKDLEILDAAERAIRARGYNAVSFRGSGGGRSA